MLKFQNFIKNLSKNPQLKLGRWARASENLTHKKIDWANEDHCGTCVEPMEHKNRNKNNQKK